MEKEKIYILYFLGKDNEDHKIVGIFSSKEKAQEAMEIVLFKEGHLKERFEIAESKLN